MFDIYLSWKILSTLVSFSFTQLTDQQNFCLWVIWALRLRQNVVHTGFFGKSTIVTFGKLRVNLVNLPFTTKLYKNANIAKFVYLYENSTGSSILVSYTIEFLHNSRLIRRIQQN